MASGSRNGSENVIGRAIESPGDHQPRYEQVGDAAVGTGVGASKPRTSGPLAANVSSPATPAGWGGGSGRWWLSVAITMVLSLPLAWILSYAAALPFLLGVFFFVLIGLFIGAIAHRIAAACRPYGSASLVVGTTCIVVLIWGVTLLKEARDFPSDMAAQAESIRDIGDRTLAEFQASVEADVRNHIATKYPPGGTLGYIQWVVRDGVFERGEIPSATKKLAASQRGVTWVVRVVLSVGLLAFGVGSQTLTLRLEREPSIRAIDAEPSQRPEPAGDTRGEMKE